MTSLQVHYPGRKPLTFRRIQAADSERMARLNAAFRLFDHLIRFAPYSSKSHLKDHALRLLNNAGLLPHSRERDNRILEIAIVLHDVGVFYSQAADHGAVSAQTIRGYLSDLSPGPAERDRICSIIRSHHQYVNPSDNSEEAIALRVLDCLDAFGEVGAYRFLEVYHRRGIRPPVIFEKARQSLGKRMESILNFPFRGRDFEFVKQAYNRADQVLGQLAKEARGEGENLGALQILDWFLGINWDISQIPRILWRHDLSEFSVDYLLALNSSFQDLVSPERI
ncbi:MAG: HD domain-containing protein [Candidatus Margulisbacteria bacterium]|nr:HD domain-containing protein [Candidatus Margulisiibacteriota bacterium]